MLKIFDRFTPRANAADTDYPFGSFKNETIPGARDGTPLNADWANDHEGFDTALLAEAGITPNGLPDTAIASQRLDAMKAAFDVYGTVADLAAGKFQVGKRVSVTDRANNVFLVQSGGTADGYGVLSAGVGKTAIIDELSPSIYAFGAKGNWNANTQTGNDDSLAFQAYINFMAAKPSKRKGGVRAIFLGDGQFKISSVTLTVEFDFGIDIFGNGRDATCIWSDPSDANPTITSEIEFVTFRNMTLFGSLSESGGATVKKDCFYRGKLPSGRADIDVKFVNCHCGYATDFVQAYGRGVTFDGGSAVYCINLLNIVCSNDTLFSGATNDTAQTGMRNYRFSDLRTDVVSRVLRISGTASQKNYINGPQISGCEFTATDRLIDTSDGRLINPLISNNSSLASFAGGVVTVSSIVGGQDIANSWKNAFNNDNQPAVSADTILWLYATTGAISGLTISGTLARGLKDGVVSAGSASNNIKIVDNQFPNAFTTTGNASRWAFYSTANCAGLTIDNNSFTSSVTNLAYKLFDIATQTDKNTYIGVNPAPWAWFDSRLMYVPKLLVGGVPTATATTAQGRYKVDANYVYVEAQVIVDPAEVSGNLSISLPFITAIAEAPAITSSYSGGGVSID